MKLQLTGIKKSYGVKEVLRDCSFSFEKGKIYGLLGRNGAGKTTLFNCLTDEVPPDGGQAMIASEDGSLRGLGPDQIGYVFSTPVLPDFLTGYEFIKFYMDINEDKIAFGKTIDDYFELVKMEPEDRHHLCLYYIFQPCSESLQVKNPFYAVINVGMYVLCFLCLQIEVGGFAFTMAVLAFTVLYIIGALALVYCRAPKSFRIK